MSERRRAFTLIELLIVVAIVAILAAVAVPNFLEAQIRSKSSAVKNDQRTVSTALEAYYVDHNIYPPTKDENDNVMHMDGMMRMPFVPTGVTTPVAYLMSIPLDSFNPKVMAHAEHAHAHSFIYLSTTNLSEAQLANYAAKVEEIDVAEVTSPPQYVLLSTGPDRKYGAMAMEMMAGPPPQYMLMYPNSTVHYDPSNGTVSKGDIVRFSKGSRG